MIWLGIETSNAPLSIAIVKDGKVLVEVVQNLKLTHSATAMPTIEELFKKASLKPTDIDAIAVSQGPGSYTGLRIGVTIAKTLAWTLQKPLVGVSSLKVLAANVDVTDGVVCSLIDARRQHVYAAVYRGSSRETVIPEQYLSLQRLLEQLQQLNEPVVFVGNDVTTFKQSISQLPLEVTFASPTLHLPRASKLVELASTERLPSTEEIHRFVPTYYRLAEAEANWIKEQKKGNNGHGSL